MAACRPPEANPTEPGLPMKKRKLDIPLDQAIPTGRDPWTGERPWPLWKRIVFPLLGLLILVGAAPAFIAVVVWIEKERAHQFGRAGAPECPPEWKCNGSPATNDPNCKCWDTR